MADVVDTAPAAQVSTRELAANVINRDHQRAVEQSPAKPLATLEAIAIDPDAKGISPPRGS